jgi:hypothetical protein
MRENRIKDDRPLAVTSGDFMAEFRVRPFLSAVNSLADVVEKSATPGSLGVELKQIGDMRGKIVRLRWSAEARFGHRMFCIFSLPMSLISFRIEIMNTDLETG